MAIIWELDARYGSKDTTVARGHVDSNSQDAIPHYVVDVLDYTVLWDLKAPFGFEGVCSGDISFLRIAPYDLTIWDSNMGPQLLISFFDTSRFPVIVGLGMVDRTLRKAEPVPLVDSPQSHHFSSAKEWVPLALYSEQRIW